MKRLPATRLLLITALTVLVSVALACCHSSGLPAADAFIPHASINRGEYDRQYGRNSAWWDKAFKFLTTQDLNNLAPGFRRVAKGTRSGQLGSAPGIQ